MASGLSAVLLGLLSTCEARADAIFVTNGDGSVGEYTTAGATVNADLRRLDHGADLLYYRRSCEHCGVWI